MRGNRPLHFAACASLLLAGGRLVRAQSPCDHTPAYSACDLTFELSDADAAAHPNPYTAVELKAELRSPHQRTYLVTGFWDGGRKMVLRFTPTEGGEWDYRLTSNIPGWEGKTGTFMAADSEAPGFVRPANVHHWAYTERNLPHLWMGATELDFASLRDADFQAVADGRAGQKFNHLRGLVLGPGDSSGYRSPDAPDPAWFDRLDARIRYLNQKGIVADLILAPTPGDLERRFPQPAQRRRFIQYLAGRYAPLNITWEGVQYFEDGPDGRALLKEIGTALKEADPYGHPRTSGARVTSAPLLGDGWMNFAAYGTGNDAVGAIEHQLYPVPFVNLDFGSESSGAGRSGQGAVDTDSFRHRLWNATMDGQYVTYNNAGGLSNTDSAGARQMTVWFNFLSGTRHWELEPYFDVDGGRALALPDAEYVVYVEKPGPVELTVEKHGYDVVWLNPVNGETTRDKFKGDHFTGEPPDHSHDWVLHVFREGHLESMGRSYKFESREIGMQEIEQDADKTPFTMEQPAGDLSMDKAVPYAAKIKRQTRATRSMMWLWTGEVPADGQGYRVLTTGQNGTFRVPAGIATNFPAVINIRLYGMNANGKVYALDRAQQLNR